MYDTSNDNQAYEKTFSASVIIKSAEEVDGKWLVSGPVCSLQEDYDGDIIQKCAIDKGMKYFEKLGRQVDWEHQYSKTKNPDVLIGRGVDVRDQDGQKWLTTELFKGKPLAKSLWLHLKEGGEAGYSIEGVARERGKGKDQAKIVDMEVHRVTISPSPKGYDARIQIGGPQPFMAVMKSIVSDVEKSDFSSWTQAPCEGGECELPSYECDEPVSKANTTHMQGDTCPDCGTTYDGDSPKSRYKKGFVAAFVGGDRNKTAIGEIGYIHGCHGKKCGKAKDLAPRAWSLANGQLHDMCDKLGIGGVCPGCGGIHGSDKAEKSVGIVESNPVKTRKKMKDAYIKDVPNKGGDPEKAVGAESKCKNCGHEWKSAPGNNPKQDFMLGYHKVFGHDGASHTPSPHAWAGKLYGNVGKMAGHDSGNAEEAWGDFVKHTESVHKGLGINSKICHDCGGVKLNTKGAKANNAAAKTGREAVEKSAWLYRNEKANVFLGWDNYLTRHPDEHGIAPILKSNLLVWDTILEDDAISAINDDENIPQIIKSWIESLSVTGADSTVVKKAMEAGEGVVQDLQTGSEALREQELLNKPKKKKKNKDEEDFEDKAEKSIQSKIVNFILSRKMKG